ncbi:MAG: DUF5343 domain-containing protein, partial [Gammaproteobacteria bacterium]|nr:DUF5343 domain-containing protein [Gammaproteobacteria bacterium]
MASPGVIPKILEKIQNARKPERFTQDFLETKLARMLHELPNFREPEPLRHV